MEEKFILELKNVSKTFNVEQDGADTLKGKVFQIFGRSQSKRIKAVSNITFSIKAGETFGLIGRNGSGKSTLVKLMSGALLPDKGGSIKKTGTSMLMNLGVGMSHELTAKENIYISGSTLGLRKKQIDEIYEKILEFAELKEFENTKTKHFSSGMKQRLAFSIAINAGADIMFLDEVFAVGDAQFRQKAIKVFEENWISGRTVIFVSHSLNNIAKYCSRTAYIANGELKFIGDSKEAIELYKKDNNETASTIDIGEELKNLKGKIANHKNQIEEHENNIVRLKKQAVMFKNKYDIMINQNLVAIPTDAPLIPKHEEIELRIKINELSIARLQEPLKKLQNQLLILEKKSYTTSD